MKEQRQATGPGAGEGSPPPEPGTPPQMRHQVAEGSPILVEESSGVAAAEATGKTWTDNAEDPEETAGSG